MTEPTTTEPGQGADKAPARRPYTMSEAALAQRRAAAERSTGPITPEGKAAVSRNGWKHGRYSAIHRSSFNSGMASMAKTFGRPCLKTCQFHPDNPERQVAPCSLVTEGLTQAGGNCLDKSVYVNAFSAIIESLSTGNNDAMHGILANETAAALQLLHELRSTIFEQGLIQKIPAITREGQIVKDEDGTIMPAKIIAHPALAHLTNLLSVLGINLPELLATPRAQTQAKRESDNTSMLQTLLGTAAQRLLPPSREVPPAIEEAGE
jgi:hypothetical protein